MAGSDCKGRTISSAAQMPEFLRVEPHFAYAGFADSVRKHPHVRKCTFHRLPVGRPRFSAYHPLSMGGSANLGQFLEAALRGAAKIVGCDSANLILFDDKAHQVRVHLGITAGARPIIKRIEQALGTSFRDFAWPMASAEGSLVARSWREALFCETSSLAELVGTALPPPALVALAQMVGERRFACVPAIGSNRNYGVLLFEKDGNQPFNRQQREVLLRYARRIGEIVENDLIGQRQILFDQILDSKPDALLFDARGELRGHGVCGGPAIERVLRDPSLLRLIGGHARAFLEESSQCEETLDLNGELHLKLSHLDFEGLQGALVLLSPRRNVQAALEHQLVRLTLGDPAPALFVDPDFLVTSCNPAAAQVLGYESAELTGKPLGRLFPAPDEVMSILSEQALDPQRAHSERTTVVRRRDAALRAVRVEALLLADDSHQLVGFLIVLRDPPQRDSDHLLYQDRLATMGEMAAHLAHEIRNPLVAIGATLDSLIHDPETAANQRPILAAVAKEVVRMDVILKDYLAARREMTVTQIHVAELIEDARRLLANAHRLAGKTISCEVAPELTLEADYEAMRHVVFNLLLNALDATPAAGEVTCAARQSGFELAITVADRGTGLAASAADCLRPFFTTKKNGIGLGLAICQKLARAHGGFVDLRNRDGGGCEATVVVPVRRNMVEETA